MPFTVRLARISPVLGDVQANLERHLELIGKATADGEDPAALHAQERLRRLA